MIKKEHLEMKVYNLMTTHRTMFTSLIMMFTGHDRKTVESTCQKLANEEFIEELEAGIWQLKLRP